MARNEYIKATIELEDKTAAGAKSAEKNIKDVTSTIEESEKKSALLGKGISKAFSTVAPILFGRGVKNVTEAIVTSTKKSANYIESLNLLDVSFNNNTDSIKRFINTYAETLNLDDKTLIDAAGHFKVLSQSMNMANETGEKFSKLLTQMTLDVSSLYNIDFDKAQTALQYAVEGRGTSLKQRTGVSVLETTVQTTLNTLGVDAYVEDMNDAEKALARVIAMEYQLRNSQGDLARTIEAPANQFRVLGEQIAMAGRNIGNIFLPMMAAILPYVNAVLIVINKLLSALAKLFGFKADNWDFVEDGASAFDDLGGAVGGVGNAAQGAAKKLQGLRGFDKLNVINTPQAGGGGGGGGGGAGGINPKLLSAFEDMFGKYNSMLDGVKTKATQIAEAFMEWLKVLEPLAKPMKELADLTYDGLVYVWENVLKPLGSWAAWELIPQVAKTLAAYLEVIYQIGKNLLPIYKSLYEKVVAPIVKIIGNALLNALKDLESILKAISNNKIAVGILTVVTAFKQLKTIMSLISKIQLRKVITDTGKVIPITLGRNIKDLTSLLFEDKKGIDALKTGWNNFLTLVSPKVVTTTKKVGTLTTATTKLKNIMSGLKTAAKGAIAAFAGFEVLKSSFQDMSKNGLKVSNVLTSIVGILVTVAGTITIVNAAVVALNISLSSSLIGLIGLLAGGFVALVAAMQNTASESPYVKETVENIDSAYKNLNTTLKDVKNSLDEARKSMIDNYEAKLRELDGAETYITSLYDIVDANGHVKEGYEEVARTLVDKINSAYGSHIELQDGVIVNDGVILANKEAMTNVTEQYIEAVKKQILWEGYQALYKDAIEKQTTAKNEYKDAVEKVNEKIQDTITKLKNEEITGSEARKILEDASTKQKNAQKKYNDVLNDTNGIIDGLTEVTDTYSKGSSEDLEKVVKGISKTSSKSSEEVNNNLKDSMKKLKTQIKDTENKHTETTKVMRNNAKKGITWSVKLDDKQCRKDWNSLVGDMRKANKGSTVDITTPATIPLGYANGGLPSVGQLFVANERGPELVGQIGGQSFVANQNQMMNLLDKKISNAGGLQNATFVIQVGSEEVARTVLKDLNGMAKSNGKPITITG